MLKLFRFSLILFIINAAVFSIDRNGENVVPGELIVKLKPGTELVAKGTHSMGYFKIDDILSQYQVEDISPVVPYKKRNPKFTDINRIYRVKYSGNTDPRVICDDLIKSENVVYAEPRYIYNEMTVPNDPDYTNQWHLPVIEANFAWSTTTGDTNAVIAIIDDAIDIDHEDLADNIFTNWAEYNGTSGVDDDDNGYVDDIHGWDFAENDNDPSPSIASQDHGTHVSGCASAVTDNDIGVAAPGWSCKILPLKFSNDQTGSLTGDAGAALIYAADMGAVVTNTSWGGGGYSQYLLDAFEYAYDMGVLSLSSAGNSYSDDAEYPSSYPHVFSVASTTTGDLKSDFSTYNLSVDISSPGSGILSTIPDNQYAYFSGTSMASPVAAGVAALIKAQFPDLTSYELALRLSSTTDNIYSNNIPEYNLKLGAGRVNANKAVNYTDNQFVSFPTRLDLVSYSFSDTAFGNSDYIYDYGEKVEMSIELYNYSIIGSNSIDLELNTTNSNLSITKGNVSGLTIDDEAGIIIENAFSIDISDSASIGVEELELAIFQDGEYLFSHPIRMNIGTAPVLIVDDDNNGPSDVNAELFYTTILDSLGIDYLIHKRSDGPINPNQINATPIVIWLCEWAFPSLDEDDRTALSSYLDLGGNLYVSGQDLGWDLNENPGDASQTEFYTNYLHANWGGDNAGTFQVNGIRGNPISDQLKFTIYQPGYDGSSQYPDYFTPANDANTIFEYDNGLGMGLSYVGDYRLVYTGVGLETFGSSFNSVAPEDVNETQKVFLERALDFLNFISHEPLTDTEDSTAAIEFHVKLFNDGAGISIPTLTYKIGNSDPITVDMLDTLDGYYYWVDGPDSTAFVEYYFNVSTQYYNWSNPINTGTPFIFNIGRDLRLPELSDLSYLENRIDRSGVEEVSVAATDNIGVAGAALHWFYASSPTAVETASMSFANHKWTGTLSYSGLEGNETVYYYATALDSAANANMGYSDTLSFKIVNTAKLTSWDNDEVGAWDTGDHWGLMYINSAVGNGMNDSPSSTYENNKSDTLTLLTPFVFSDYNSSYLQFWNGSFLKSGDIGTAELSSNGIDWTTVYSITGMNLVKTTTLDVTDYQESGVYIRFIIETNDSEVSSGWFIDDIYVLADTLVDLSVDDQLVHLPTDYNLYQNYPNPFNPVTKIIYDLPSQSKIRLEVFDLLGRNVTTLVEGTKSSGKYSIIWNGKDQFDKPVSAGVYFYQLQTENYVQTRKMLLLK